MSLQQFDQDTEESRRKLSELLTMVGNGRSQAETANGRLDETLSPLESDLDAVETSLAALASRAGELEGQWDEQAVSTTVAFHQLRDFAAAAEQRTTDSLDEVRTAQQVLRTSLESATSELEQTFGHLKERLETLRQQAEELGDDVAEGQQATAQTCSQLTGNLSQAQEQLDQAQVAAEGAADRLEGELAGSLQDSLQNLFASYSEMVSARLRDSFLDKLGDVETGLKDLADDFDDEVQTLAEQFSERVAKVLEELKTHAGDKLDDEIKQALEDVVRDAIADFVSEVAESAAITKIGAASTTALAPHVGELLLLQKATGLINSIL